MKGKVTKKNSEQIIITELNPMYDAPKDGREILIYGRIQDGRSDENRICIAYFNDCTQTFIANGFQLDDEELVGWTPSPIIDRNCKISTKTNTTK